MEEIFNSIACLIEITLKSTSKVTHFSKAKLIKIRHFRTDFWEIFSTEKSTGGLEFKVQHRIPTVKLKIPEKAFLNPNPELLLHSSYSFWP